MNVWTKWGARHLALVLLVLSASPSAAQDVDAPRPAEAGWTVTIDPMRDLLDNMNGEARRAGAPMFAQGVAFEMTRDGANYSYEDREVLSEGWALALANMLEAAGLEITSDVRLRRHTGMSVADFRDRMIRGQPYAIRETVERHAGHGIYILLDEQPPTCPPDNGFLAMVLPYYPDEDVDSDYGSVAVFLLGIGPCASNAASRRHLADIVRDIKSDFANQ